MAAPHMSRRMTPSPEVDILGNNNVMRGDESIGRTHVTEVTEAERALAFASLHLAADSSPWMIRALLMVLTPCCGLESTWCRLVHMLPTDLAANVRLQLSILLPDEFDPFDA